MSRSPVFENRTRAGEKLGQVVQEALAEQVKKSGVESQPIVYGLPRGGLPVAVPVARSLGCPLTIMVAKKISHPRNPELAIGAVTASGEVLWNQAQLLVSKLNAQEREAALKAAIAKAKYQQEQLLPACGVVNPQGATLILVDDGIATGMTVAVAARALQTLAPAQVWICTPVAPGSLIPWLQQWCDRVITLKAPASFFSVSNFYGEFHQLDTTEALHCLKQQWTMNN